MALTKEIWIESIVGNLFKDGSFLAQAVNHSEFVTNKTVHVPNAGTPPTVVKNRDTFPGTASGRTDADVYYNIDEFSTDPIRIADAEKVELSYDKRESIVAASRGALAEAVGDNILLSWVPASYDLVKTSGSGVAAHLPSQTSTRKACVKADILAVKKIMDKNSVPQEGRYAVLDYEMYNQLLESLTESQANAFLASADAQKGTVGSIYGFGIFLRATALRCVAAGTSLASSDAATDQAAGLFWQKDCVSVAQGETKLFESTDDPTYYGDIVSALVRAGGKYIRNDKKGVVVLAQQNA